MTDKISKKLTMAERFVLLSNLPQSGDLVTFKILRKLRETLAPTEAEIKDYGFKDSYRCPYREFNEGGKASQCEVETESEGVPKCHIHNISMQPIGRVSWNPDKWGTEKEIWLGSRANSIIVDALKKTNEDKKVDSDILAQLCDKFLTSEEEEE